jgi:hypothetical protein
MVWCGGDTVMFGIGALEGSSGVLVAMFLRRDDALCRGRFWAVSDA